MHFNTRRACYSTNYSTASNGLMTGSPASSQRRVAVGLTGLVENGADVTDVSREPRHRRHREDREVLVGRGGSQPEGRKSSGRRWWRQVNPAGCRRTLPSVVVTR